MRWQRSTRKAGGRRTVSGVALGALMMYVLDPELGPRRLAAARERALRALRTSREIAVAGLRDLGWRAQGVGAHVRDRVYRGTVDDRVVGDRVRDALGRVAANPHAIGVDVASGDVRLTGTVHEHERDRIVRAVRAVSGVREVHSLLEASERRRAAVAEAPLPGPRNAFTQEAWPAGPRLLALVGGLAIALYGFNRERGRFTGALIGAAGAGLAMRAWTNESTGRMLRKALGELPVEIERSIHVAADPEELFDLWSRFENFPYFMSLVKEVRRIDDDHSHWIVRTPAGAKLQWTTVVDERIAGRWLSWHSEPGAPVEHAGSVRFEQAGDGTTVTVHLSYCPPGGTLGATVASILGRNPLAEIDADLLRMKSFVETGRTQEIADGDLGIFFETPRLH